ncbi:MAG: hypothetical protein L0K27_03330 [Corynebacterium nuruki]|nr:hypothetical protein [Corynebacterium nuruki]
MPNDRMSSSKHLAYLQLTAEQAEHFDTKSSELGKLITPGSTTDSYVVFDHDSGEWGINVGSVDGPRFAFHIPGKIGSWGCNTTAQERRVLGLYYADHGVTGTVHVMRKGKPGYSEVKEFQKDIFPRQGIVDTNRGQGTPATGRRGIFPGPSSRG